LADFGTRAAPGKVAGNGEGHISTQILCAGMAESGLVWAAAIAIPILLAGAGCHFRGADRGDPELLRRR